MSRRKPPNDVPTTIVLPTSSVRTLAITSLIPDQGNVRRRDDRARSTLEASVRQFGPARSIVIDGRDVVRAGNGALEAAQAAGSTEVLVVRPGPGQVVAVQRDDWSATEATAYAIADNRTGELATWDDTGLVEQLRSLESEDFNLDSIGFTDDEIDELNERLGDVLLNGDGAADDPGPQIDRADELQRKWKTKRGQLWTIPSKTAGGGVHRLLCGDSTNVDDVERVTGGEKVDVGITSPPYNLGNNHHTGGHNTQAYHDDMPESEYQDCQSMLLEALAGYITGDFFYQHKNRIKQKEWISPLDWIRRGVWRLRQEIVWINGGPNFDQCRFYPQTERIYWLTKEGTETKFKNIENLTDYWNIEPQGSSGEHTRAYPVEIPRRLIVSMTARTILDPFVGSGTTIVAAEQTGRLARGIEIEPKYVAVALERLAGLGLEPRIA